MDNLYRLHRNLRILCPKFGLSILLLTARLKTIARVVFRIWGSGWFTLWICLWTLYAEERFNEIVPRQMQPSDFMKLNLEELMRINVTSVSKKEEKLTNTAAATFVITQEDLRRGGVTSIPEALRMVPGLQVARMDSNKWAITSRGFNSRFANKLLVMIDGRSVYTPLFSGTFWEIQDTLFENIDRIEVIRGPGGALWGANAVNGVINIITKDSHKTTGTYSSAGLGTEETGFAETRFGAKANKHLAYRFYIKGFTRDDGDVGDESGHDDWRMGRGGFRADITAVDESIFTLQGDYYRGEAEQRVLVPDFTSPTLLRTVDEDVSLTGGNVLFRWTKPLGNQSDWILQMYYDRTERDEFLYEENRDTFDFDFQYRFPLMELHEFMVGFGYRLSADNLKGSNITSISQQRRNDQLFSMFIRDELTLIPDHLLLTLGSKFEHNDYTEFEYQPSASVLLIPSDKQTIWGSISRAVRTPSRLERTATFTGITATATELSFFRVVSDDSFDSEELLAYELGYRIQPSDRLSLDLATFYNVYDDLQTAEFFPTQEFAQGTEPPSFHPRNKMDGEAYGAEFAARWQLFDWCQIHGFYALVDLQLHVDEDSLDTQRENIFEDDIPTHQYSLRFLIDLPYNIELDSWFRYVDNIRSGGNSVSNYFTVDIHLGWRPLDSLEFTVVGQNLLDSAHKEYVPSTLLNTQITEVERGVYGKVSWWF